MDPNLKTEIKHEWRSSPAVEILNCEGEGRNRQLIVCPCRECGALRLSVIPSLRLSLLLTLIAQAVYYLRLDRAVLRRAEQSGATRAGGSCAGCPPSCHSLCSCRWKRAHRNTFQVPRHSAHHLDGLHFTHTQASCVVIKGAATGRSCREQKVKTYWILVQRASQQAEDSGRPAAFVTSGVQARSVWREP